jgi:hypothetical protein
MTTEELGFHSGAPAVAQTRSDGSRLYLATIGAGLAWAIVFVVVGLRYDLQLYGDGAVFSYAVAVQDAWSYHWHNIAGRLFVYLYAMAPAEAYVGLTQDARGGVVLYGLLFLSSQLFGLIATWFADRSPGRVIFGFACLSTALVCPLVFGFPTETFISHALFWPILALCHSSRATPPKLALIFGLIVALMLTHLGAVIFVAAIVATLFLRRSKEMAWWAAAFLVAGFAIRLGVKVTFKPDAYISGILWRAAMNVFNPTYIINDLLRLFAALALIYSVAFLALRRMTPSRAHILAAAFSASVLITYWLLFDTALHAQDRYYMRTVVITATPLLGLVAVLAAFGRDLQSRHLQSVSGMLHRPAVSRAALGALAVAMLLHAGETTKFVTAWSEYKSAVQSLARSSVSDPTLGDSQFVSSQRISSTLNRVSWFSTTHFMSVLVAPNLSPARLVIDPASNYFWLSCRAATKTLENASAVPAISRLLIGKYSCLHRKT